MFSCAAHVYRNKNGQFSIHDEQDRDTAYDPQCPGLFYVTSVRQLPAFFSAAVPHYSKITHSDTWNNPLLL